MADLAQSAVTIERAWTEGGPSGKDLSCRQVTLVLTAQGTLTNKIPAAVLSLQKIEQASPAQTDDNSALYLAAPSYDGANLLLYDVSNGTDATRDAPADITDTLRLVVKGIPA